MESIVFQSQAMVIGIEYRIGLGISGIKVFRLAQRIGIQDRVIKNQISGGEIFTCTLQRKACCRIHQFTRHRSLRAGLSKNHNRNAPALTDVQWLLQPDYSSPTKQADWMTLFEAFPQGTGIQRWNLTKKNPHTTMNHQKSHIQRKDTPRNQQIYSISYFLSNKKLFSIMDPVIVF